MAKLVPVNITTFNDAPTRLKRNKEEIAVMVADYPGENAMS
jgi:hypothetical protein